MQPPSSIAMTGIVFAAGMVGGLFWLDSEGTSLFDSWRTSHQSEVHWPSVGEAYPDLELLDLNGNLVRLSKYRGRVLILEPVAICCPGCQAFSGGNEKGGYAGFQPQSNLPSFERLFSRYSGELSLSDPRLTFVQILFYGSSESRSPTLEEARGWARHFGMDSSANKVVLIAPRHLLSEETWAMIPSFQLLDKDFVLRADAGNPPRQDLYRELIPQVRKLLRN